MTNTKLIVQNTIVSITRIEQADFISLTDIAKVKNPNEPKDVVKNWLRTRSTIELIGLWEKINNPNLKESNSTPLKAKPVRIALPCYPIWKASMPNLSGKALRKLIGLLL